MKVVCAPASFKESLSAQTAAAAMARGVQRAAPACICNTCPVGDGGEGTMDALLNAMNGKTITARVRGPLGEPVNASFGVVHSQRLGIVELAQASGLMLVPKNRRDPTQTTSFGTGELIRAALKHGCDEIIICIGGSATVDGGTGLAQALGARFFDQAGTLIEQHMTGGMLSSISRVEIPRDLPRIRVACDVNNPLCGPNGAAAVYGPQKGATPEQVKLLEKGLAHLARIVGGDMNHPGAGAAGGAGFGLMAMCGATLERGIELVLDAINFEDRCRGRTLVLTGEGRLDAQSLQGKACIGVASAAAKAGVPTVAIVGSTGPGAEMCIDPKREGLLRSYFSLSERFGIERSMHDAEALIELMTQECVRDFARDPHLPRR